MKNIYLTLLCLFFYVSLLGQTFTDSNLPIVIITTDINPDTGNFTEIVDEPKVLATMKIIYHPDGSRNYLTDQNNPDYLDYDGRISIEFRGSTSQSLPKKPYGLTTLKNDNTSNNNVEILGMPEENDWVLNSLAFDQSLIRDYLTYGLIRNIGDYVSRGKYCELMVNGDYKGLYILGEKIKIDSNRVNLEKMDEEANNFPEITGGYLIKCDKTTGGDPVAWSYPTSSGQNVDFIHTNPKPDEITEAQNEYIKAVFDNLIAVTNNQNAAISNGYPSVIDVPSFVDFMLINELTSNVDAYQISTYFHKDRGGKLYAGPVWDFNLSYGNDFAFDQGRSRTDVWQFDNGDNVGASFWKDLFDNEVFKCYLSRRWNTLTAEGEPLNYGTIIDEIDALGNLLAEAKMRENQRWNTLNNYNQEITDLKAWLQQRIAWINLHLESAEECAFSEVPNLVISEINYHPEDIGDIKGDDLEFIALVNNSESTVNLTGIYFRTLGISYQFPIGATIAPHEKIYLASNSTIFEKYYTFAPFGEYIRDLSNKSQQLLLVDAFGNTIDEVTYKDDTPWPTEADGDGAYLILNSVDADNSLAENWSATTKSLSIDTIIPTTDHTVIYPNPAQGILFVENQNLVIQEVQLYDLTGRLVLESKETANRVELQLNTIAKANYLIKITFKNGTSVVKQVMKQ